MDVITHECGHAFQGYLLRDEEIREFADITMETAEIHSMSMEYFAYNWMELFFGDRKDDYLKMHLEDSAAFVPYGCMVDEFQHIVYEKPEMTPAERKAVWAGLEKFTARTWITKKILSLDRAASGRNSRTFLAARSIILITVLQVCVRCSSKS